MSPAISLRFLPNARDVEDLHKESACEPRVSIASLNCASSSLTHHAIPRERVRHEFKDCGIAAVFLASLIASSDILSAFLLAISVLGSVSRKVKNRPKESSSRPVPCGFFLFRIRYTSSQLCNVPITLPAEKLSPKEKSFLTSRRSYFRPSSPGTCCASWKGHCPSAAAPHRWDVLPFGFPPYYVFYTYDLSRGDVPGADFWEQLPSPQSNSCVSSIGSCRLGSRHDAMRLPRYRARSTSIYHPFPGDCEQLPQRSLQKLLFPRRCILKPPLIRTFSQRGDTCDEPAFDDAPPK